MSILETVNRAKAHLREHGRVSLRMLKREFELDDDALDELVEELVDVQQVAGLEGKVLDRRELGLQMAIGAPLTAARGWSRPEYEHLRARAIWRPISASPLSCRECWWEWRMPIS